MEMYANRKYVEIVLVSAEQERLILEILVAARVDYAVVTTSFPAQALGSMKSKRKAKAARENGRKGGRPKKNTA